MNGGCNRTKESIEILADGVKTAGPRQAATAWGGTIEFGMASHPPSNQRAACRARKHLLQVVKRVLLFQRQPLHFLEHAIFFSNDLICAICRRLQQC